MIHFLCDLQAFCDVMVDKFSSINMKSTTTNSVLELKGELRLICCNRDTWELWTQFFDAHSSGDLVNPDTKEKYCAEKTCECPPLLREFFRSLQGLTELELKRCAVHALENTLERTLSYPEKFFEKAKAQAWHLLHPGLVRSLEDEDGCDEGVEQHCPYLQPF